MVKLFPKARRRKPGLYAYRTRRHMRRGTEWGYAGMSTNLPLRYHCHQGTCAHVTCTEKPWYDLKAAYFELRLPWWLGWKWFLLSIETVMIVTLRPRYNVQKNPRRSKVSRNAQVIQRAMRNRFSLSGQAPRLRLSPLDLFIRTTAVLLIIGGPLGYLLTR